MKMYASTAAIFFVYALPVAICFQPVHFMKSKLVEGASPALNASPGDGDDNSGFLSQMAGAFEFGNSPVVQSKKALIKRQAGSYDEETIRAQLNAFIGKNPVAMLSFTTCPYCLKAKEILDKAGVEYKVMELDKVPSGGYEFRAELAELTDRTSVPAIWIDGKFVGGYNDGGMGGIDNLKKSGKLQDLLEELGAVAEA
eukprot:CAMPEP_0198145948 /NCGR_PEP_ID=MMETSP1443-20131203/26379_1 /TAXON_ID=186043 /ORGANISM="Entomoneis sp., Strain CCMP2396" /LENGTH=197 /DNA_ID=CAMNT_0043809723 /DNA_START=45 /DNA_END=638 /DNA_ORIENTATION=+